MKLILTAILLAIPFSAFSAERIIGVGIVLKKAEHAFYVEKLIPHAPVARDGRIQEGDQIVSVQPLEGSEPSWTPAEQLSMDELVQLIRGDEGTRVGLHMGNDRGQYEVFLTRETIAVP